MSKLLTPLFMDFETYYDKEYSLRKMTPAEYILNPKFQTIGLAVKIGVDGVTTWIERDNIGDFLNRIGPKHLVVTHNALFDACIMAWVYDFVPSISADTLAISRATLSYKLSSLALASVARHLGVGEKGDAIMQSMGHTLESLKAAGLYKGFVRYAKNDADLTAGIWQKLVVEGRFPVNELIIMDSVIRCATQPLFRANGAVLRRYLDTVREHKQSLLDRSGVSDPKELNSNPRFAELLIANGVEPPTKISPTTGKETFAFAKTDPEFLELLDHPNHEVSLLVAARLGHKTSIEETRTQRYLTISRLPWNGTHSTNGKTKLKLDSAAAVLPVPLKYSGAHTHRLSGDWKMNAQNLARGGMIRRSLEAPDDDHIIVTVDASQIEARGVGWFSGDRRLTKLFASGEDVYSTFASVVYGRVITKADKAERQLGKVCILGLGYGMGLDRLTLQLKLSGLDIPHSLIASAHAAYREQFPAVPALWRTLDDIILPTLQAGRAKDFRLGPVRPGKAVKRLDGILRISEQSIILPNGLSLYYPDLNINDDRGYTYAGPRGSRKRLWGGSLTENIIQSLARVLTMDASTRIRRRGLRFSMQAHDELVYIVPKKLQRMAEVILYEEMTRVPDWAKGWPIEAETGSGSNYADAK